MKTKNIWVVKIAIITFIVAVFMSIISEAALSSTELIPASLLLLFIIFMGVFFDTIGIAVASASMKPFNSMASQKIKAAKHSIYLIKNASMIANICNDVIGDIAGIISGAAGSIIIIKILQMEISFFDKGIISVILTGIIASLTVGGKAIGKIVGLEHSKEIVRKSGIVLFYMDKTFKLKLVKR